MKKRCLSKTSMMHYFKLVFRSLLLVWAFLTYITDPSLHHLSFQTLEPRYLPVLIFVWIVFVIEILLRFFPSEIESRGSQKQFKKNYMPTHPGQVKPKLNSFKSTAMAAWSWIMLNGIIGILYSASIIDDGILVLISLVFSVSDMICILFFCPFQTWIMKNRCCGTCRIYNWDYLMMFSPLIFARSFFTWSLFIFSAILVVRWELTVRLHPERFIEEYNAYMKCENCTEKLCSHKKQLASFWRSQRKKIAKLEEDIQGQVGKLEESFHDQISKLEEHVPPKGKPHH